MDDTIYIEIPMPTIILQIPSIRIILSHEFSNGSQYGLYSMGAHSSHSENKEDEDYANDIDEEIDEDIIEAVIKDNIKKEELEVEKIKQEIKEEIMLFQYPINEQLNSDERIFYSSVLSPLPEVVIKDEPYDWEQFSIE